MLRGQIRRRAAVLIQKVERGNQARTRARQKGSGSNVSNRVGGSSSLSVGGASLIDSHEHEVMHIGIITDVGLQLAVEPLDPRLDLACAAAYRVIGPPMCLSRMPHLSKAALTLSPQSPVTVAPEHRAAAGIPATAAKFAFIYPMEDAELESLSLHQHPWGYVLYLGGFAYFDARHTLLQVNALSLDPSETGLELVGPHVCDGAALGAMRKAARMRPVTLDGLREVGFETFGWVHPSEAPQGTPLSADVACTYGHGAFLYSVKPERRPRHRPQVAESALFYAMRVGSGGPGGGGGGGGGERGGTRRGGSAAAARLSASASGSGRGSAAKAAVGRLARGMSSLQRRAEGAARAKAEAQRIVAIAASREQPKASRAELLRHYATTAALFVAFVALGVLYYCLVDRSFTFIDACYFIVVTMSTVGYGDFIGETSSRWFTAVVVQLIGSTMIFTLIGGCVDDLLQALESAFWRCVCVCVGRRRDHAASASAGAAGGQKGRRSKRSDGKGGDTFGSSSGGGGGEEEEDDGTDDDDDEADEDGGISDAHQLVQPAWRFYVGRLSFLVCFGVLTTQLLSAFVFTRLIPDLSYDDALWLCWVTATTVGYGDVPIPNQRGRAFAAFNMLFSVGWLAALIQRVQAARELRRRRLQRAALISIQLSGKLISALDTDGGGVDKVTFVARMPISMGVQLYGQPLDYAHDVQPLLARFDALDADANGHLTHADIEFMVAQAQKFHPQLAQQTSPELHASQRFMLHLPGHGSKAAAAAAAHSAEQLAETSGIVRARWNNGVARMLSRPKRRHSAPGTSGRIDTPLEVSV